MIQCEPRVLEAHAIARGYKMADVMACVVNRDGELWLVDEKHPAYPRHRPGLGDLVAGGLESIGVTKDRVSRLLGVKDCGCRKRQKLLNQAGHWLGIGTPPPPSTGPTG